MATAKTVQKAKTFTDGNGVVRPVQTVKPPPPKTPAVPVPRPTSGVSTVPAGTPAPVAAPSRASSGVGTVPAGTPAPVAAPGSTPTSGFLKARQKQPNGTWKVVLVHRSTLSPAELKVVLANGLNGGTTSTPTPSTHADPGGGGAGPGAAPPAAAPPVPAGPTWQPPRIGLGGINVDPLTGKIDWSSIINAAGGVAATDATYAQELSSALAQIQGQVAVPQSEIAALTAVNPATGKTLYQTLIANAMQQSQRAASSAMGSAASRGIGSSGMVDTSLGQVAADDAARRQEIEQQAGAARIAALVNSITQAMQTGASTFDSAYYGALARAYGGLGTIGG